MCAELTTLENNKNSTYKLVIKIDFLLCCPYGSSSTSYYISVKYNFMLHYVLCLVTQSCRILCDPMDCSLPGSSVYGDSPGKNTGVHCHALLQGIIPTQGSNPCLPHYKWILYHLSHQGSPPYLIN